MKIIHLLIFLTVSIFPLKAESFNSAVRVKALIPESARTVSFLGQKREGTGMMIDAEGRILTIGYIVPEAKSVEITNVDGRVIPASVEGYDVNSGFGLLKALSLLRAQPLLLADSSNIQAQEQLSVVSGLNDIVQQQVFVLERATIAG